MKTLLTAAIVLALALAFWLTRRGHSTARTAEPRATIPAAATIAPAAATITPAAAAAHAVPAHVEKLASPEERREVEQRIAGARAARAAHAASPEAPHLPAAAPQGIASLPTATRDALEEAIPYLAGCFGSDSPRAPVVQMTLEGDPDVGTLIDPGQMTDDKGAALEPALADCLHTTLTSLKLPPLAEGSSVKLQYSFRL